MLLNHTSFRAFLAEELNRRLNENPRYSQRAFAKQLGLSPGELSEILRGKRGLSTRSVARISKSLGLSSTETRHLALLAQAGKSEEIKTDQEYASDLKETERLDLEKFSVVADWYHFAILNLTEVEGFRWREKWISKRLGIPFSQAALAMHRLEKLGLVTRLSHGKVRKSDRALVVGDGVPSEAIRRYHQQILKLAMASLDLQKLEEREVSGISFALGKDALPSIKKDISEFLDAMLAKYSKAKKKKDVYQLELALFRLTRGEHND